MATYRESGGARVGWFNATFPFAVLRLEDGALTLSVLGYRYVFQPGDVVRVEAAGFFSSGLRIVHTGEEAESVLHEGEGHHLAGGDTEGVVAFGGRKAPEDVLAVAF
jgi:hypothetical protein